MRVARLATMSSRNYVYDLMARVAIFGTYLILLP
jgi:hypothetical protein